MSDTIHSPDDSFKTNDSDDSIYPQINLKGIRINSSKLSPLAKALTPSSHLHIFFSQEQEVVLEEPEEPAINEDTTIKRRSSRTYFDDDPYMTSSTRSKFKHLNIVTDSDEFNNNTSNTNANNTNDLMTSSCGSASRYRNSSVDLMQTSLNNGKVNNMIVEEHRAADEDENNECRPQLLKLSENSMHLIDDVLQLDPGEFYHSSCSSTPKKSSTSKPLVGLLSRKSSHKDSIFSSTTQAGQQDNDLVIHEEHEMKEEEENKKTGGASVLEKFHPTIIADEFDAQKATSVHRSMYFMTQSAPIIEEELKDEETSSTISQLRANQAAKQERDSKIEYINKIVKNDLIQDVHVQRLATSLGSSHLLTHVPLDRIISEDAEVIDDE